MLSSEIPSSEEHSNLSKGIDFRISWKTLAGMLEVASKRWYTRSSQKRAQASQSTAPSPVDEDLLKKWKAVVELTELSKIPLNFASRSVMLLEALRVRMGLVEVSQGGSLKKLRNSYKSGKLL